MNDLETAKLNLNGHSLCFCKNPAVFTADGRGISPVLGLLKEGRDLSGFSCADVIVGKAAAMLFVKAGVTAVYGKTMSESGKAFLDKSGVHAEYGVLTEKIINRAGTDICPMEKCSSTLNAAPRKRAWSRRERIWL